MVMAYLFAQLVELKDKNPTAIPHSYATIYAHIRQCVDLCHRDGVIKVRGQLCSHLHTTRRDYDPEPIPPTTPHPTPPHRTAWRRTPGRTSSRTRAW